MRTRQSTDAVYVHVPFCHGGKCRYCDFYSVACDPILELIFLEGLKTEISLTASCIMPETIFIGGGTPTSLSLFVLAAMLDLISIFPKERLIEFSVEANPGTLTSEKLMLLKESGVNRLSIGAQSFIEGNLIFLGRSHNSRAIYESVELARKYGFRSISLDLISDIPKSTREDFRHDLFEAISTQVEHISVYSLSIEDGTPLSKAYQHGEFESLDDEESASRLALTADILESHGYIRYEISNYAKPGHECKHNNIYWRNGSYLGLGPSAVSYTSEIRRKNVADIRLYAEMLKKGKLPIYEQETLADEEFAGETAMLMLRRRKGVNAMEFMRITGYDAMTFFAATIERLRNSSLLIVDNSGFRVPADRFHMTDTIAAEFLETSK